MTTLNALNIGDARASIRAELRLREELDDLRQRFAGSLCKCGHVFSDHRKLWGGDEPWLAWRCDESDGCMDFALTPSEDK